MDAIAQPDGQNAANGRGRAFVARILAVLAFLAWVACDSFVPVQGWDEKLGPVIPHDSFPADCALCHRGSDWHTLKDDFVFDHAKQTGVALHGAHVDAACLLCHNDRGPVSHYAAQGCAGCHADRPIAGLVIQKA